jgi:hypothetical protein
MRDDRFRVDPITRTTMTPLAPVGLQGPRPPARHRKQRQEPGPDEYLREPEEPIGASYSPPRVGTDSPVPDAPQPSQQGGPPSSVAARLRLLQAYRTQAQTSHTEYEG